ncbi:MAG: nucleotidyltransferase domain-containing protein [Succinivibrio sp.]|nr:nucleotidyltransferase domain-containing protein [Succinivibrio sp.]
MRASEALRQHRDEVKALFKEAEKDGIFNVRLVGSVSKGKDTEKSDVDFLVSTPVQGKLLKVLYLGTRLEEILNKKVDILIEESLPIYLYYMVEESVKYE